VVGSAGVTTTYNDGANTFSIVVDTAVVATTTNTLTMTNKTLTSPTINTPILTVNDNQFTIQDDGDNTKKAMFQASGISTATTRTYTFPNANGTLALTSDLSSFIDGSGSANQVPYFTDSNSITGNANFIFDGSNLIVGTTTAASSTRLTSRGSGTNGSTFSFVTQDSAGTQSFAVDDSGNISVGKASRVTIGPGSIVPSQTYIIGNSAFGVQIRTSLSSALGVLIESTVIGGSVTIGNSSYNSTSVAKTTLFSTDTFNPAGAGTNTFTSFTINSVINQTGGHTGITRGININPTLTAFTDYRSLELSVNSANAWGIYQSGASSKNYFAGNVSIGTSTISDTLRVSGTFKLDLGSDATGDIYYRNSGGLITRLPVGTNGHVLTLATGLPSWAAPSGGVTSVAITDSADIDFSITEASPAPNISGVLTTTGVTGAAYGSASSVATFTVDSKGRLSAAASTSISITSTAVSNFTEAVQDVVGALVVGSAGVTTTYNDGANTFSVVVDTAVVATTTNTLTMTNKTLTSPTINTPILTVNDNQFTIQDDGDTTKKAMFQASGITTGTTRTYTFPNANGTLALTSDIVSTTVTQVFIESFSGPTIDLDANDGTVKDYDGTNVSFTLPSNLSALSVTKNGIPQYRSGTGTTRDYSVNVGTNVITFEVSITTSDVIVITKIV